MATTRRSTSRFYFFRRAAFGLLAVLILTSFYLASAQLIAWHVTSVSIPVNQYAEQLPCAATDASYCSLLRRLVPAVEAEDFSQLLASQAPTSAVCPNSAIGLYCNDAGVGVPVSLFTVYQASQPKLMTRNDYIAFFRSYEGRTGKLSYIPSKSGAQNPVLFRDQHGVVRLELQLLQQSSGRWQFIQSIALE